MACTSTNQPAVVLTFMRQRMPIESSAACRTLASPSDRVQALAWRLDAPCKHETVASVAASGRTVVPFASRPAFCGCMLRRQL